MVENPLEHRALGKTGLKFSCKSLFSLFRSEVWSGIGVASMGVMRPELVMKYIVPVVMTGVLGIYGLIISVIISTCINPKAKS